MAAVDMRAFWDARARENAPYFVESGLDYHDPDLTRFWASGEEVVTGICAQAGVTIAPTDEVVEVGCGIGRLTRPLAARAASVRALDVSPEMLSRARTANPGLAGVEWILSDGASLAPVADASADGVFSHVVFQHLPDPDLTYRYVAEMGRVLRPGGWAAFQVSDDPAVHARPSWRHRVSDALRRGPRGRSHPAWLGSAVDLAALETAAAAAGLTTMAVSGAGTQYCVVGLRTSLPGRSR